MKKFIFASTNKHKTDELKELFLNSTIEISASEQSLEVEENGNTFYENALIKAQAYYQKFKMPVLADDSGLEVVALPDKLGVHSARYGGPGLSSIQRNQLLLTELEKFPLDEQRKASFHCVLCFYLSPEEIYFFEGKVDGVIGQSLRGEGGFGYDPLFIPLNFIDQRTSLAEVHEWKQKNSHRAKACLAACDFFKESNCHF